MHPVFDLQQRYDITAALLGCLGWLFRKWIATRLTESVRLDTEKKLNEFKARLNATEAQVSAVRQAGIDATLQLNAAAVAERVAAIKHIWKGTVDWKAATALSMIVSAMSLDYVKKNAGELGTRDAMTKMLDSLKYMEVMKAMNALQEWRPFITERAWALFTAYNAFYIARIMRAFSLSMGDKEMAMRLWEIDSELQVVKAAAPPQMVQAYEANSIGTTQTFLSFVEQELLAELQKSLAGEHGGPEASRQAARIVAAVGEAIQEAQTKAKVPVAP